MTQIQTAKVQESYSFPRAKMFRCVNGVVQIERKKRIEYFETSLAGHVEELADFNSTLDDALIIHEEAYNDDDYLVEAKTFVTGWTTEMSKAESEVAASLSWDG